jgi:hypothetical protein
MSNFACDPVDSEAKIPHTSKHPDGDKTIQWPPPSEKAEIDLPKQCLRRSLRGDRVSWFDTQSSDEPWPFPNRVGGHSPYTTTR